LSNVGLSKKIQAITAQWKLGWHKQPHIHPSLSPPRSSLYIPN
jgi:hypothetical protein